MHQTRLGTTDLAKRLVAETAVVMLVASVLWQDCTLFSEHLCYSEKKAETVINNTVRLKRNGR